jgi:radical SAM superfamily enzyme YgiQ (UPF0313 family)
MDACDVLLIIPPFDFTMLNSVTGRRTGRSGYYLYYPPLGLCSMAGALRAQGYAAGVADAQFDRTWPGSLLDRVRAQRPALVGVLTTTPVLPVVHELVQALRTLRETEKLDFRIVAGGAHVSCDPGIVPDLGADFGVVGDGELPVCGLADLLVRAQGRAADVPGLVWVEDGVLRQNEPAPANAVRDYPPPDRSVLNRNKYFNPFLPVPTTTVISARGCPFQCAFCCRSQSMGSYRPRPVEAFLQEVEQVQAEGYGFVSIIDETFTFDKKRAAAIARGLLRLGPKFAWSCQTRADTVDEDILRIIKRAGCINISFGVEAGDSAVRGAMEKGVDNDHFVRAFSLCKKIGISTNAFLMIGSPGEDRAAVQRSVNFAKKLDPDYVVFNIATLFPGAAYYDALLEKGAVDRDIWTQYMRGQAPLPVLNEDLGKPELVDLLNRAYRSFYLRPAFMAKKLAAIRSPRQMWHLARQAATVVGDYVMKSS